MDEISPKPANTTLIALTVGILLAFFYYPVIGHLVFTGRGYTTGTVFWSRIFIWLELPLLYFYAHKIEKTDVLLWQEKAYGFWWYPACFFVLYLLAIAAGALSVIPRLFGWHDNQEIMQQMQKIINKNIAFVFFGSITAGITEELIVRGYILPRLEVLFNNKYMPVIISSLMFGAMHFRYFSLTEVIFATLFGVVFAIHYQKYRNIKILMVTHALIDLISFLVHKYVGPIKH